MSSLYLKCTQRGSIYWFKTISPLPHVIFFPSSSYTPKFTSHTPFLALFVPRLYLFYPFCIYLTPFVLFYPYCIHFTLIISISLLSFLLFPSHFPLFLFLFSYFSLRWHRLITRYYIYTSERIYIETWCILTSLDKVFMTGLRIRTWSYPRFFYGSMLPAWTCIYIKNQNYSE
jgi:hypothetical protein